MLVTLFMVLMLMICLAAIATTSVIILAGFLFFMALFVAVVLSMYHSSVTGLMLFNVYVGGLLVSFGYFLMMGSNERFVSLKHFKKLKLLIIGVIGLVMVGVDVYPQMEEMWSVESSVTFMIKSQDWGVMPFISVMLFYAMVVVVKVCDIKKGAMRPFKIIEGDRPKFKKDLGLKKFCGSG